MIKKLKLKNFKCHRDLEVDFIEGLNVIKGANERGKSTLYHAIAYALWGSRALPESLEQTVTWGEPVASLKVELTFEHVGVEYQIVRSKSGAELTGPGVTSVGQAEVSAFVERLFGASYQVGFSTLIASQTSLQSGLDSSAISLIEKLSNMGVIDEYITRIQETLPSGNTKGLEAQLEKYADLAKPEADFSALEVANETARVVAEQAQRAAKVCAEAAQRAETRAESARRRLTEQATLDGARLTLEQRLAEVRERLAQPVPETPGIDIASLETAQRAQAAAERARHAWGLFQKLPQAGTRTPTDNFVQRYRGLVADRRVVTENLSLLREKIAEVSAKRITQSACGLCGKDLENVPEVQATNKVLNDKISSLEREKTEFESSLSSVEAAIDESVAADRLHNSILENSAGIREFVHVDVTEVPALVTWVGPKISERPDTIDYGTLIRDAKHAAKTYADACAERQSLESTEKSLADQLTQMPQQVCLPGDEQAVEAGLTARAEAHRADLSARDAKLAWERAGWALTTAQQEYETLVVAYQAAQQAKQELEELLHTTTFHNGLIKKLREARAVVARELWGMVLTGVSQIFSHIRGVPTVVSRTTNGFLVDGRPVSSYSGSTKDALGLAIRIMLQKTFMGNLSFLLLDEPAAACDAEREVDMLAAIARAEFQQVILVTHSERADTLASNIVTL